MRGLPGSGGYGIEIWPPVNGGTVKASIDHCDVESSSGGIELVGETGTTIDLVVRDSVLAFNGGGLSVEANPGGFVQAFADRCSFFGNGSGIYTNNPNARLRVTRSSITNNVTGMSAYLGGAIETIGNNMVRGNGTDKDVDGASTITIRPGD